MINQGCLFATCIILSGCSPQENESNSQNITEGDDYDISIVDELHASCADVSYDGIIDGLCLGCDESKIKKEYLWEELNRESVFHDMAFAGYHNFQVRALKNDSGIVMAIELCNSFAAGKYAEWNNECDNIYLLTNNDKDDYYKFVLSFLERKHHVQPVKSKISKHFEELYITDTTKRDLDFNKLNLAPIEDSFLWHSFDSDFVNEFDLGDIVLVVGKRNRRIIEGSELVEVDSCVDGVVILLYCKQLLNQYNNRHAEAYIAN